MKKLISATLCALAASSALVATAFISTDAEARNYRHGHGHSHSRARVGVYIGAPVIAPWRPYHYGFGYGYGYGYPYGYPYYAPAPVVIQEQPTVYVEQNAPAAAPPAPVAAPQAQQQQPYWYFCQDTQTYYPHVQTCASPWQRVIPHAPQTTQ